MSAGCSKLNTEDKEEPVEHLRVPVHIIIAFIGFVLCVLFLVLFLVILVKKKVSGNCKSYQVSCINKQIFVMQLAQCYDCEA